MCIWDSYVYQKVVLCFFIYECYIRSVKRYFFVHKYAAVPVQLEIVMRQYIGWCVIIIIIIIMSLVTGLFFLAILLNQR